MVNRSTSTSASADVSLTDKVERRTLLKALVACSAFGGASFFDFTSGLTEALAQQNAPPNLPPLEVEVDLDRVDLEARKLEVKMSREAARIVLKVFDSENQLIDERDIDFSNKAAGSILIASWKQKSSETVARIDVYAYDAFGFYKAVRIVPWSLSIPHEDVQFKTNSAEIVTSEEPKLEASYKLISEAVNKHRELGNITLFIAGHTDTQGKDSHNLQLSRDRASTIARWFRKRGYKGPLAYEGFGETALKVGTADNVDEAKNRRVDYLLGLNPPRIKARGMAPSWKSI